MCFISDSNSNKDRYQKSLHFNIIIIIIFSSFYKNFKSVEAGILSFVK